MRQVKIVVKGHVDRDWSDWFSEFEINHNAGNSILTGPIRDQAELRGILSRVADLGLELISVNTSRSPISERPTKGGDEFVAKNGSLKPKEN